MRRRLVPFSYAIRSLLVRWQASLMSALGIAMTVAVFCGVFALLTGFTSLHVNTGQDDVVVFMRKGATSEGESGMPLDRVQQYKVLPEVALDPADGTPLAAGESYLALFLQKADDTKSLVNVPIRGVEDASFRIQGALFRIVEGRNIAFGADEIIVGKPLVSRIHNCQLGDTLTVNVTPFKVVGIFEHTGAYRSEIWGDIDRIAAALERPIRQRVVAKLSPGTELAPFVERMNEDKRLPSKTMTERDYFVSQTGMLTGVLGFLGIFLAVILGIAAVLGAANTMLAAIGARTKEIGVLRSLGFGAGAIMFSFLFEAALIGLAGGIIGSLIVLPLDGLETGTMNWNTFTENAFAFQVSLKLLAVAIGLAVLLGVLGGLAPAWRAARLKPVEAMRRQ